MNKVKKLCSVTQNTVHVYVMSDAVRFAAVLFYAYW